MVFFTCNSCGESLKKNKVDKHLSQCRSKSVSCVDCGKDFTRYDFQSHNQCISEDQKYGGLDYKPKDNSTKGKAKQEEWIEKVNGAINESKCDDHIKNSLKRLSGYDNIPRKKQKFFNFVRSSIGLRNDYYVLQMWNVFEGILKSDSDNNNNNNGNQKESTQNGVKRVSNDSEINEKNKKQKSKETENKEQTKDENRTEVNVENNKSNVSKTQHFNPTEDTEEDNFEVKPKLKIKKIVIQILENSENNEMSVKKLKKKTIKRLKSMDENLSKEYIESKFLSKLKKIKKIELNEEKVSLKRQ